MRNLTSLTRALGRRFSQLVGPGGKKPSSTPANCRAPRVRPHGDLFPPIEEELGPFRHYFKGNVLNAGSGHRDIRHLVEGRLFNQDLPALAPNPNVDIFSPLHEIPIEDAFFDAIICNAVLEHVANPEEIMREFQRVCKPDGILYLAVPFMQPEHLCPTDYQRYTIDGLQSLVRKHNFVVIKAEGIHSVYTTVGWICTEWCQAATGLDRLILRWLLLPYLHAKAKRSRLHVPTVASTYRVLARRSAT